MSVTFSLFCGVGGMDLGFEQAGFTVAAAVELNEVHAQTYAQNFSNPVLCQSVTDTTRSRLYSAAGLSNHAGVDVIFGGPPCQSFSMAGKRDPSDVRSNLLFDFLRVVGEVRPKFFVLENVKGLTMGSCAKVLEEAIAQAKEAGYTCTPWRVLNAKDYGVAQHRERLFLLGSRCDMPLIQYPTPHVGGVTCGQVLADMPKHLSGQKLTQHSSQTIARFEATEPGKREPVSRFTRLHPDGIAPTLRAGTHRQKGSKSGRHTAVRPIHHALPRCCTVRELARLHGYPDSFEFAPTICDGAMQIGNSVPPPLAKAVAMMVKAALQHTKLSR